MFCLSPVALLNLNFSKLKTSIYGMRGYFCILLLRVCGLQCLTHMLKDALYYCSVPSYMVSNYLNQFSCFFFFFFFFFYFPYLRHITDLVVKPAKPVGWGHALTMWSHILAIAEFKFQRVAIKSFSCPWDADSACALSSLVFLWEKSQKVIESFQLHFGSDDGDGFAK